MRFLWNEIIICDEKLEKVVSIHKFCMKDKLLVFSNKYYLQQNKINK